MELAALRLGTVLFGEDPGYFGLTKITDWWYDWRTGLNTGGIIAQSDIKIDPDAERNYIATAPRAWYRLMRHLPIQPQRFTYVDLGCGKGRTLMLASRWGFKRVIGVDLSETMAQIAESNIVKARAAGVEVVRSDAAEYQFPDERLVMFLYNPFWGNVIERVAGNLHASVTRKPREVYVVYWNPHFREMWDRISSLELYRQCDAIYPAYVIYRTRSSGDAVPQ